MHTIRIHLWPKLESSAIKPIIETVMPMEAFSAPQCDTPPTRKEQRSSP